MTGCYFDFYERLASNLCLFMQLLLPGETKSQTSVLLEGEDMQVWFLKEQLSSWTIQLDIFFLSLTSVLFSPFFRHWNWWVCLPVRVVILTFWLYHILANCFECAPGSDWKENLLPVASLPFQTWCAVAWLNQCFLYLSSLLILLSILLGDGVKSCTNCEVET